MSGHEHMAGINIGLSWYDEFSRPLTDLAKAMRSGSDNMIQELDMLSTPLIEPPHPDYFPVFFHPDVRIEP